MADAYDLKIAQIASRDVSSIEDVIAVMQQLDRELVTTDGLRFFNLLYLRVTESVRASPPAGGWLDQRWLERLDVVFARLYFTAIHQWASDRNEVPRCWRALLEARWRRDVARIQFALAGMNAHINHDLALALRRTSQERGEMPARGSAQHQDFERVNTLLERVEAEVKGLLLSNQLGAVERHLGQIDDAIALWKVRKARDTAWSNGDLLWQIRQLPLVVGELMRNIDRLVGLSSKGLLIPTQLK